MTDLDYSLLQGRWLQTHSSWGADRFGCVMQQFRPVDDEGRLYIDVSWVAFQATLTPLDKGAYANTYYLSPLPNG